MKPPQIARQGLISAAILARSMYQDQGYPETEKTATSQIWIENGFLPPPVCREAVELLHHLTIDDETVEGDGIALVIGIAMRALRLPESRFHIADIQKIEDTAIEYGVAIAGRDASAIARDVTAMIIADYDQ